VVSTGEIVRVKVMEIDEKRKRIALSMRLSDDPANAGDRKQAKPAGSQPESASRQKKHTAKKPKTHTGGRDSKPAIGSLGDALLQAQNKKQKR